MDQRRERVVSSVSDGLRATIVSTSPPSAPAALTAELARAVTDIAAAEAAQQAEAQQSYTFSSVRLRNVEDGLRVRTRVELLDALCPELRTARTLGQAAEAAQALHSRMLATGAFRSIQMHSEPSEPSGTDAPAPRERRGDLHVLVNEGSFGLTTGVETSFGGVVTSKTTLQLLNPTGMGDRVDVSLTTGTTTAAASSSVSSALQGQAPLVPTLKTMRSQLFSPSVSASYARPTLFGVRAPFVATLRSDTEHTEMVLGHARKLQELELGVSDGSGRHGLTYLYSLRNVLPVAKPGAFYDTLSSPLVCANAHASTKSSLTYSYALRHLRGAGAPVAGYRLGANVEVAGPGGDAHFVKSELSAGLYASVLRFQPDTGYAQSLDSAEWNKREVAREVAAATGHATAHAQEEEDQTGGLRPHPRPNLFSSSPSSASSPSSSSSASTSALFLPRFGPYRAEPYSFGHRLAGWLSPGITLSLEASAGAMRSYGPDAGRTGGVRLPDRFFLTGARMRGFDAVAPLTAPQPGGAPYGDAIGGDVYAYGCAKLLLPPPVPSVRLANAGVRTHLYACAGRVGSLDGLVSAGPRGFLDEVSASAGVGVTLPLMTRMGIELNYSMWHHKQPGDATCSFRVQLS